MKKPQNALHALTTDPLYLYTLRQADNALILGQRLGEWCGHGPVLEQDIALTNLALDLIGQSRLYYQYAADLRQDGSSEDDLALLRKEQEYYNLLLVEQPNIDFAHTIARQYFFDVYHYYNYIGLKESSDERLAGIAEKSIKEVTYHLRYSSEWMLRLGDGTEESHNRLQTAVDNLWPFTGELYTPNDVDRLAVQQQIAPALSWVKKAWFEHVEKTLAEATIVQPETGWMHRGGKDGKHTENMGYILTELQYMQRTYPGVKW